MLFRSGVDGGVGGSGREEMGTSEIENRAPDGDGLGECVGKSLSEFRGQVQLLPDGGGRRTFPRRVESTRTILRNFITQSPGGEKVHLPLLLRDQRHERQVRSSQVEVVHLDMTVGRLEIRVRSRILLGADVPASCALVRCSTVRWGAGEEKRTYRLLGSRGRPCGPRAG